MPVSLTSMTTCTGSIFDSKDSVFNFLKSALMEEEAEEDRLALAASKPAPMEQKENLRDSLWSLDSTLDFLDETMDGYNNIDYVPDESTSFQMRESVPVKNDAPSNIVQSGRPNASQNKTETVDGSIRSVSPSVPVKLPLRGKHVKVEGTKECICDDVKESDVLFGQGGESNNHAGNKSYRARLVGTRPSYSKASSSEKTNIAQRVVDEINDTGGRFLKKDKGRWYVASNRDARRKVSQALREKHLTTEARAAKRAKYTKNIKKQ